jgi:hypothetical protein
MIDPFDEAQEESLFPTLIDSDSYDGPFCQECGDQDSYCRYCQEDKEEDFVEVSTDDEDFANAY